jgi:hypothetical protein
MMLYTEEDGIWDLAYLMGVELGSREVSTRRGLVGVTTHHLALFHMLGRADPVTCCLTLNPETTDLAMWYIVQMRNRLAHYTPTSLTERKDRGLRHMRFDLANPPPPGPTSVPMLDFHCSDIVGEMESRWTAAHVQILELVKGTPDEYALTPTELRIRALTTVRRDLEDLMPQRIKDLTSELT